MSKSLHLKQITLGIYLVFSSSQNCHRMLPSLWG